MTEGTQQVVAVEFKEILVHNAPTLHPAPA
jgi:hypothetical protein